MEIGEELGKEIDNAALVIKSGGLVAYPTETVYGLGADPFNRIAVLKVFGVKNRDMNKPLSVAVCSIEQMAKLAFTNKMSRKLYENFLPGPITMVMRKKALLPKEINSGSGKIGIRVPDNEIALELIKRAGPITATSANISGENETTSPSDVKKQIGDKIDMVIRGGITKGGIPSTVVDVTGEFPIILREGPVKIEEIEECVSD